MKRDDFLITVGLRRPPRMPHRRAPSWPSRKRERRRRPLPDPPRPKYRFHRKRSMPLVWSVGVTTAPRAVSTQRYDAMAQERGFRSGPAIEWTLESLANAGWDDITVFAETKSHKPESGYSRWIERPQPLGSWKNWRASLHQLMNDRPDADVFMLCQDDVIFCRGLREFLDATLWPDDTGIVSLYCSARYSAGSGLIPLSRHVFWGALALLFRKETVEAVLKQHLGKEEGNRIDVRLGSWCTQQRRKMWVYTPSLAQHTGEYRSTLQHGGGGGLSASDFRGEHFDCRTLVFEKASDRGVAIALPVYGCGEHACTCIDRVKNNFTRVKNNFTLWLIDDCGPREDWRMAQNAAESSGIPTKILINDENRGFSPSVNRVICEAKDDHVLILNSDAYMAGDVLTPLLRHLDDNPTIGAIGPFEWRLDTVGPHNDIRKRPSHISFVPRLPHDAEKVATELADRPAFEDHPILSYFCTLLRREALNEVGGLDERLADGLAADDLHCKRLAKKGWKVGIAQDALCLHQGSASFRAAGLPKRNMQRKAWQNYKKILSGVP